MQLVELQKLTSEFEAAGATIVPISVDDPGKSRELKEKLNLSFDLYQDTAGMVATGWGVFDSKSGYNLAATFVVAKGGEVVFRYLGTGKGDRPTAADVLAIAQKDQ